MARFYDDVSNFMHRRDSPLMPIVTVQGLTTPVSIEKMRLSAELARDIFPDATVFNVQNVAEYVTSGGKEQWDLTKDFPNLAPPYNACWFEYRAPRELFRNLRQIGVLMAWENMLHVIDEMVKSDNQISNLAAVHKIVNDYPGAKWYCIAFLIGGDGDTARGPALCASMAFGVKSDGSVVVQHGADGEPGVTMHLPIERGLEGDEDGDWFASQVRTVLVPALLAVSLLHCKNVTVKTSEPPRKLVQHHQKAGRSLVTFHTLDIKPMRTVLEHEGHASTGGLKRALHIVRAHFKTYTVDAPLLGKHTGTWFWGSMVRGSVEHGIALKDYKVEPPPDGKP